MNERIRELMLEAGYAAPEIAGRANKFAELLLDDVIGLVKLWERDSRNHVSYLLENYYNKERPL